MPGALIYGANQLKEQNKLYVSGSYELSEGKKKKRKKKRNILDILKKEKIGFDDVEKES